MPGEMVFEVKDSIAIRAVPIGLEDAGLRERDHLQEWVIANPEVLGEGILIVTTEYDRWITNAGSVERDRLDVLGLGTDGRLVVAELKRGHAPDTVEMQALKYAAMASRFNLETLAGAYGEFRRSQNEDISDSESLERLNNHTQFTVDIETLRSPRIVLLASSFPYNVTSTAVWLSEMGIDISLIQFQAYRLDDKVLISVSQLYPVRDVAEFTVAPTRESKRSPKQSDFPIVDWSASDYLRLAEIVTNSTVIAALDLCAAYPAEWIALRSVEERSRRTKHEARADLAGLTVMVKRRFERDNWPFEAGWEAAGPGQIYYRMSPQQAAMWLNSQGDSLRT